MVEHRVFQTKILEQFDLATVEVVKISHHVFRIDYCEYHITLKRQDK
jgi:hypothetical protein